jgi:hypothetical protein
MDPYALLIAPATPWPRLAWGARVVAAGIAFGGLGVRWWSMIVLGRFYTRRLRRLPPDRCAVRDRGG